MLSDKYALKGETSANLNGKQNALNRTISLTGKVTGSIHDTGGALSLQTAVSLAISDVANLQASLDAKVSGPAGGDLSGSYPNPTIHNRRLLKPTLNGDSTNWHKFFILTPNEANCIYRVRFMGGTSNLPSERNVDVIIKADSRGGSRGWFSGTRSDSFFRIASENTTTGAVALWFYNSGDLRLMPEIEITVERGFESGLNDFALTTSLSSQSAAPAMIAYRDDRQDKFNVPTGTASQYLLGNGSLATFPSIPTVGDGQLNILVNGAQISPTGGNYTANKANASTYDITRQALRTGIGELPSTNIADAAVTNAKLRSSAARSVIGNSTDASRAPADIAAGSDHQVLRRSGALIGFGAVNLAQGNAVTGRLPPSNMGPPCQSGNTGLSISTSGVISGMTAGFGYAWFSNTGSTGNTITLPTGVPEGSMLVVSNGTSVPRTLLRGGSDGLNLNGHPDTLGSQRYALFFRLNSTAWARLA
jgi:hypothetical protein